MQYKERWNSLEKWKKVTAIAVGIVTVLAFLGNVALAVDNRYSKEEDLKDLKIKQMEQQVEYNDKIIANTKLLKNSLRGLVKRDLADKIFKLEFKEAKGTLTDLEKALLPKYKRELADLNKE